jgi:exopolysaccharide biosynthesis predicted pyruvyltransferase EpsI
MLHGKPINKRFLKHVSSHVTSISSKIMTNEGKKAMKKALKDYPDVIVAVEGANMQDLFPDIEPFMQIVEDYYMLLEHG